MQATIRYLAIVSQDPERLARFYTGVFGMREMGRSSAGDISITDGGYNLSLLAARPRSARPARSSSASRSTTARRSRSAAALRPGPTLQPDEGGLHRGEYYVADPNGFAIAVSTTEFGLNGGPNPLPAIRHAAMSSPTASRWPTSISTSSGWRRRGRPLERDRSLPDRRHDQPGAPRRCRGDPATGRKVSIDHYKAGLTHYGFETPRVGEFIEQLPPRTSGASSGWTAATRPITTASLTPTGTTATCASRAPGATASNALPAPRSSSRFQQRGADSCAFKGKAGLVPRRPAPGRPPSDPANPRRCCMAIETPRIVAPPLEAIPVPETSAPLRLSGWDHIGFSVPDLVEAERWYIDVLGAELSAAAVGRRDRPPRPAARGHPHRRRRAQPVPGRLHHGRHGRPAPFPLRLHLRQPGRARAVAGAPPRQERAAAQQRRGPRPSRSGAISLYFEDPWGAKLEITTWVSDYAPPRPRSPSAAASSWAPRTPAATAARSKPPPGDGRAKHSPIPGRRWGRYPPSASPHHIAHPRMIAGETTMQRRSGGFGICVGGLLLGLVACAPAAPQRASAEPTGSAPAAAPPPARVFAAPLQAVVDAARGGRAAVALERRRAAGGEFAV